MNISSVDQRFKPVLAWIVCLAAGLFFSYELMQFHMLNAISSMLLKDLHMSATQFGVLGSTYLLADVIFLLPAGIILDRFSPRKVILTALFICILGTLGFSLSTTFFQACLSHFLSGIGNAFCFLSCMIFVSRWFPLQKQAFVIGVIVTLGMLGGVVAQAPFSYLAHHVTWRSAVLIDGAVGLFLFLLIFFVVKNAPQNHKQEASVKTHSFWKDLTSCFYNRQTLLCGLYTGCTNLPLMVIGAAWGSLFLYHVHAIALSKASFIAGMICMGTIVGSSLCGFLSDYMGKRKLLMLVGALSSLIIMVLIMTIQHASIPMMTTLFFLLGLSSSTQVLSYPLIAENTPSHLTGTSMSIAAVIIMGLAAIAQLLSGQLMDLSWNRLIVNGSPIYQAKDFMNCFMMFPIGLILASFSLIWIKESKSPTEVVSY
ncbi:MAG: MFS transporter [Chlamydiota bacterium]